MSIFNDDNFKEGPDHWPQNKPSPDQFPLGSQSGREYRFEVNTVPADGLLADPETLAREIREIGDKPVAGIQMGALSALSILGALQLALRHPGFAERSASRETVEDMARYIERQFASFPGLARIAAAGWHPQHDVKTESTPTAEAPLPADPGAALREMDRETAFLNALPIEEREALEQEAQALMLPPLREKLEAYYASGHAPGPVTAAALEKARWEAVRVRMRMQQPPND